MTLQTVDVQVTDKHGNDVRGLSANDFTVREDGRPQKIAFFDAGAAPVTVAVLVDSSVSLSRDSRVGSAGQVASEFARIARPGDEIYAMDFAFQPGPFERLTSEQLRTSRPLMVPAAGDAGPAVYDAIATAICHLRDSRNPRQAIVVITDGIDEYSRLTLNRLIDAVRLQRAQLFLIGFQSKKQFRSYDHAEPTIELQGGHDIDNPAHVFRRLAKQAGAETFILDSESALQKALQAVSDTLNAEYTLAYYPPPTRRKVRHIQVRVDRHGLRVLASRTIIWNQVSGDTVHYLPGTCFVSPTAYPHAFEMHLSGKPGALVYRDDFSDPQSGWPIHSDMHYVAGGYELSTGPLPSGPYKVDVIAADGPPEPGWDDFRLSATVKFGLLPAASDQSTFFSLRIRPAAGLVFRLSWRGYYALLLSPTSHPKQWEFELVARAWPGDFRTESVIIPWKTVFFLQRVPQQWKAQLAVQDVGDEITLFVNGRQVGAARDDTFHGGGEGFIVGMAREDSSDGNYEGFIHSAPLRAIFSNFLVEQK